MDIINEMTKIIEFSELLKTENGEVHEELELKEEEIKKLLVDLAQKSNEVFGLHSNLDDQQNGLKSKLMNRDQEIEELKKQIDHSKINHMVALENQIVVQKEEIKNLHQFLKDEGYIYEADKGWLKESRTTETQCDFPEPEPEPEKETSAYLKRRAAMTPTTDEQRKRNFRAFIHLHYAWIKLPTPRKNTAHTPFRDIMNHIHEVSGTKKKSESLYLTSGPHAHWPSQKDMNKILKSFTLEKYNFWNGTYHGTSDRLRMYDLKLKK